MNLKSILLLGFVISLVLVLLNSFLYFHTMKSYNDISEAEGGSDTVYGDDIAITFLSTKSLYRSGENLDFHIYVDNKGDEFISNIDFTINVRYVSISDVKIFSKDHYSDRGFNGGTIDIIRIGSRGHIDVILPSITPSGIYELELVATPENKDTLPPAKVRMFVVQRPIHLSLYLFGMILFFILYKKFEAKKFEAAFVDFSIGQKFVFGGICLLISTAVVLSVGLSMFADKFAILAYYSLVVGVLNILFENFQESRESKVSINGNVLSRINLSLLVFIFLIIFSISELGITISLLSVLVLIAIRRMF